LAGDLIYLLTWAAIDTIRAWQCDTGRVPAWESNCGLETVHTSFCHDGYIGEVMKPYLPDEALYMLRFHSFYPWHKHGAYDHLCNDKDRTCWNGC